MADDGVPGANGDLLVGGVGLTTVAAEYGTPTYVIDETDVRLRCRDYVAAFGHDGVAYTAKALLSRGIARWLAEEGLGLYVGSAGELRVGSGEADAAVARLAAQPGLRLVGLDCSVGHQVSRFAVYEREVRRVVEFLASVRARHGIEMTEVNLGGGHAVAYSGEEFGFALGAFANRMRAVLRLNAERHCVPVPRLTVSPGRAIVSRAGITLYHVLSVTDCENERRLIAVDGGMTDCPVSALCGGQHTAVLFGRTTCATPIPTTVVGRHNDVEDVVVPTLQLPSDVHPGDLLAVAGSGAYHHSRASNYHLVARPALLSMCDGRISTLVRRESAADLLARDVDEQGWCGRRSS
jgi:diaminopimelate decarboxylase